MTNLDITNIDGTQPNAEPGPDDAPIKGVDNVSYLSLLGENGNVVRWKSTVVRIGNVGKQTVGRGARGSIPSVLALLILPNLFRVKLSFSSIPAPLAGIINSSCLRGSSLVCSISRMSEVSCFRCRVNGCRFGASRWSDVGPRSNRICDVSQGADRQKVWCQENVRGGRFSGCEQLDLFLGQDVSANLVGDNTAKDRDEAVLRWTMQRTRTQHQGQSREEGKVFVVYFGAIGDTALGRG